MIGGGDVTTKQGLPNLGAADGDVLQNFLWYFFHGIAVVHCFVLQ